MPFPEYTYPRELILSINNHFGDRFAVDEIVTTLNNTGGNLLRALDNLEQKAKSGQTFTQIPQLQLGPNGQPQCNEGGNGDLGLPFPPELVYLLQTQLHCSKMQLYNEWHKSGGDLLKCMSTIKQMNQFTH